MEVSKLNFYSLGLVAVNKPLSSKDIEVTPIEDLPMMNGEITDNAGSVEANAQDTDGAAYSVNVPASGTVRATWLPLGHSNRMSAPDVRRGEHVVLFRFADADKYYWTTLFIDAKLRKLETVIYAFSATTDEGATSDASNMYYMEVSTHRKTVHFHTSKANGEPFAYDIQINAADGTFILQDDAGNTYTLDSRAKRLTMKNGDGSIVDVNARNINIFASDSVSIKTKTFNLDAPTINSKGTIDHTGTMDSSGEIKSAGKSVPFHTHTGVHGQTSPPN